eukprot:Gregarina_sp_Poly_1__2091@NODE_154_length_12409_cov_137_944904_g136_i0_p12_GENE_NODE_154_length_12409_cov_137_944904_g136_i0NODE_154_length_12409_cov_137_944904_g136_i0_p12_ORF_typecomplete_len119_score8_04_NODE_154_length_12409_cov_137_944904_g136_i036273983
MQHISQSVNAFLHIFKSSEFMCSSDFVNADFGKQSICSIFTQHRSASKFRSKLSCHGHTPWEQTQPDQNVRNANLTRNCSSTTWFSFHSLLNASYKSIVTHMIRWVMFEHRARHSSLL